MSATARVVAEAKVNLLLRVLAREASGYHAIETVFQRIALGDVVTVRTAVRGRSLDCAGPAMPIEGLGPVERNLAWRAATAYAAATGWPSDFAIEIEKRIPVGGGLGGGSADAAGVLRALDALAPHPLGGRRLELAGALGSDVPFLASDAALALAWGRGERMLALPPLLEREVVLLVPPFGVGTAEGYGWVAESRDEYRPRPSLLSPAQLSTWGGVASLAANDFEPVVAARHSVIDEYLGELRRCGAEIALMSGSGSTVFGVFGDGAGRVSAPRDTAIVRTRTVTRAAPVERMD